MLGNGNTNHDVRNTGIREVKVQGRGASRLKKVQLVGSSKQGSCS